MGLVGLYKACLYGKMNATTKLAEAGQFKGRQRDFAEVLLTVGEIHNCLYWCDMARKYRALVANHMLEASYVRNAAESDPWSKFLDNAELFFYRF
jgi:hypothetical protein